MTIAPGAYVTVTAAPPSPNGNVPTGTWFITGQTAQGPTGVAVPVTSLTDYTTFFGPRVSYGYLYDSLDEFFHDGGVLAYVSRVTGPGAATATVVLPDRTTPTPNNTLTFTASGAGSWANGASGGLAVVVANGSQANSYTVQVFNNGVAVGSPSPNLFTPADAVTWFGALKPWIAQVYVTNNGATTGGVVTSANNPAPGTYNLSGGSDDLAGTTDAQWTAALVPFNASYGPGQVSAPGHTTLAGYQALANHAAASTINRYAVLDVADNALATSLTPQAAGVQQNVIDPSFASMFAPWIIIPGITSTAPGTSSPIPNRVCPPSALAAAAMAANDQSNDANNAAAGPNGQSTFAIGVTHTYNQTDLASLNVAGINAIRQIQNVTTVYGNRSLALDPNWIQSSWARFRMQMTNDFQNIAEGFVFGEIDGKGHLFAALNGALAGQCQQYWVNGSLYGLNPQDSFAVNTGPQVNTVATIAAGQINAQVLVRLSPTAEVVEINVVKYLSSATLPTV